MSKAQRFFRYVWRANAILIFVAAAFAAFGIGTVLFSQLKWSSARRRANEAAPPVRGEGTDPRLTLGGFSLVEGTSVFRAKLFLHQYGEGLSSGGYSETRNIFFLDGSSGVGRWLLSGDTQVITYSEDLSTEGEGVIPRHPVATLVLAKPASGSLEMSDGRLILADPVGRQVQTVAEGVQEVNGVALNEAGELAILFSRNRKYVLTSFDSGSLKKKEEREIDVPKLK